VTGSNGIIDSLAGPYGLARDASCEPLGRGHINTTFLVHSGDRQLVAQRINLAIFPQPAQLVNNAVTIGEHLLACERYTLRVPLHLPDRSGTYLHGPDRNLRVLEYVAGSTILGDAPGIERARAAATAFAGFTAALADLDPQRIAIVIPDFHNLHSRLLHLQQAVREDRAGRAANCALEVAFCLEQDEMARQWRAAVAALPLRTCHNDAKLDNLLVDENSGSPLAVIDLDTCMPGHLMTDFGDLVRSGACAQPEDSADLAEVVADPRYLRALTDGYLEGLGSAASKGERSSLALGARLVCFLQGLRFLTDYLEGDPYFGAKHSQHNLERARNQLQLYRSVCEQSNVIEEITAG
jgi:Ser/Thr protein kinase RdoA (MazF antagonist)